MNNQKHLAYSHILTAIANGETIQFYGNHPWHGDTWYDQTSGQCLREIAEYDYSPDRYRVKPGVCMIGKLEIPEPLRTAPEEETPIYIPSFGLSGFTMYRWKDTEGHKQLLSGGLVHLTSEAAIAHSEALISITKGSR